MSYRILLVDPNLTASAVAEQALVRAGNRVAAVSTFEQARRQISLCPDLLITTIRLGAYNGLHLLLRLRSVHPDLPVIIVGALDDFTSDISRFGARFVTYPIDTTSLLGMVSELLAGRTPHDPGSERLWPRKTAALPATALETSARVVEMSYGGLRLEMSESPGRIESPFHISLPTLGLSVKAVLRWSKPAEDGAAWRCGAEVALACSDATGTWRSIVDSLD